MIQSISIKAAAVCNARKLHWCDFMLAGAGAAAPAGEREEDEFKSLRSGAIAH
jgi:hypothetical protein